MAQNDLDIFNLKGGNEEYQKSTIKARAITDSKSKAKKWLLFPSFVITGTPLSFKLLEKTIDPKEASIIEGYWLSSMGIIGGSVTISSYTTYSIFTRTDKIVYLKDLKNEGDKREYKSI